MNLFRFEKEQRVCDIDGVRVGGQPGVHPTVLIGSMFHKGDKLIADRKGGDFDKGSARKQIKTMKALSERTAIPGMLDIVGNTADEISGYMEFVAGETEVPFCVDAWKPEVRIEAARRAGQAGLLERLVYNSLNPWNPDIESEVEAIAGAGVKHVIVAVFDETDKLGSGRVASLERLLPIIESGKFKSVMVDTTVMNVAAMAFSLEGGFLIKERFGLPVGCAPSNGTYMWKELRARTTREGFAGADAAAHGIAALLWNDFLFYGPMTGTERIFAAAAAAESVKAMFGYAVSRSLRIGESHPLNTLFAEFLKQLEAENK